MPDVSDDFAERLRDRLAPLLHAVERRRVRAEQRRGALFRPACDDGMDSKAAHEHRKWEEVSEAYAKAHEHLLDALHWSRTAANLLLRMRNGD